jgi:multisubunit Na+/H+ antiporter MnhC subunit
LAPIPLEYVLTAIVILLAVLAMVLAGFTALLVRRMFQETRLPRETPDPDDAHVRRHPLRARR